MCMTKQGSFIITLLIILTISALFLPEVASAKAPKGSQIANISVAGKSDSEVKQLLEDEISIWKSGEDIALTSDFEQLMIPRSLFQFDIESTINQFNEKTKRTFSSLFMRPKNVHIPLNLKLDDEHEAIQALREKNYIDVDHTLANLTEISSQLENSPASLTYIKGKDIPLDTIAQLEMKIPSLSNAVLTYAIEELNDHIIAPNDTFSFLQTVTFPEALTTSTEEASFLATALYPLFIQTNFEIVERHAQLTIPSYAEAGLDVAVSEKENKDLIVINPNNVSFKFEVIRKGDTLDIAIKSSSLNDTYDYELKNVREIKQRTLYRYSKKLKAGEQATIQAGREGLEVEVHRSTNKNNKSIDSELISQDVYLPVPKIVLVSTKEELPEEDLDDHTEEELEETIDGKLDDLEQSVNELESDVNVEENDSILGDIPLNPASTTFTEQLQNIKKTQSDLVEKISRLEKEYETLSITSEKEMKEYQNEVEERFDKMNEQIDKLLDYYLNGNTEVEEGAD